MKKFNIEAKVKVYDFQPSDDANKRIADMLRYDIGEVLGRTEEQVKGGKIVTFKIWSHRYTKARWDSFGVETKELEMIKRA